MTLPLFPIRGRWPRLAGLLLWVLGLLPLAGHAQLYYLLDDGSASTTLDQPRAVALGGSGDALVRSGVVQTGRSLVLDAAGNRLLLADGRANNAKIVALSLASGNAATTLFTPPTIAGASRATLAGLALDATNRYLYYTLDDGSATTALDQVRRVGLDGTGDVLIKSGAVQTAGPLVLDAANNRLLLADSRVNNAKIVAVSLASGNAVSTFFTPTTIASAASTQLAGLALDAANAQLYYTLNDGSATATLDQVRRVSLAGTGDALLKSGAVQTAGGLVLDAANNRLLLADSRVNNAKIVAVSLASSNAVSTFFTPTTIAGATATALTGLALQQVVAPTVSTSSPATNVASTSATVGGTLTADGGATLTDYGIVYVAGTGTPTTASSKVRAGSSSPGSFPANFAVNLTGLAAGTQYTAAAYATNSAGTSYGATITFTTPTTLASIVRASASPTNAATVSYTVTFATPVTGLTTSNFSITTTGSISGASVSSVAGSGTTYTATLNTGSGSGTLRLDLASAAGIAPSVSNVPYTSGETYTIDKTAPSAPVITAPAANAFVATTTPTIAGTAEAGSTVIVREGTTTLGTTTADGSGTWTLTSAALGQGSHTVTATATDAAGNVSPTATQAFTVDTVPPTVAISSAAGNSGSTTTTSPIPFTLTFSETVTGFVQGDLTVTGGTISGFSGSGTTYTFSVTPTSSGSTATVSIAAGVAQDGAGNGNTAAAPFSITYQQPSATIAAITGQTPTPTATVQVSYTVTFSSAVSGLSTSNFTLTSTGSISGAAVASVAGSGTTYTVVVNTGTDNGTLRLNMANSTGVTPTISNVPYTSGTIYTITKSFAAAPTLRLQGVGSASGNSDVTAFVDVVQVLSSGAAVAGALANNSFESNNVASGNFLYSPSVVAAPWTFGTQAGVTRNGSGFGSTAYSGDAVALLQSTAGNNGSMLQNLAVPMGSYQVSFQAAQRNYTSKDQVVNVFVNDVFVGGIQPPSTAAYQTFTSAPFSVTAPNLTATVSTTSASPTSTSPIPFAVSFSQSVGSTFVASDVTVGGGTLTNGSFSGSGSGPYTFTVTPSGAGTVTVSLSAGVASDANNTPNQASNSVSVQFQAPTITVAPASLPGGTQGTAYSVTFSASGGSGSYTYAASGTLPNGLTLAGNSLSGTPTAAGTYNFRLTATDNSAAPGPYSGFRDYTLAIAAPVITLAPASLPGSTVGVAYSQTFTAAGGTAPYSYAITTGALPAGLSLASNGTLAGTPTQSGTFSFAVRATDSSTGSGPYSSASTSYSLTIAATATTWTGTTSTDWYTAANWTAGVPTATLDATVPAGTVFAPVIASGTATTRSLTLNGGAQLTMSGGTLDVRSNLTNNGLLVPTGGTVVLGTTTLGNLFGSGNTRFWNLTVGASGAQQSTSASTSVQRVLLLNGSLATQGNPFTLESSASGTALVVNSGGSVVTGSVTVQRYLSPALNPGLGYRHYSAPIGTATVAGLATASYVPVVNPAYNTSPTPARERPFPTVLGYDQARLATTSNDLDLFTKGWYSPGSLTDALAVGQGYAVNIGAGQRVSATGPLNNGDLTVTLARNSGATAGDAGLALVGNPYPAPLDWSQVAAGDRPGLDGTVYVFESTSQYGGQYRSYTNGVGGDPVVAQGQGFFVRVTPGQTSGTLTFRNAQRLTTYQDPALYRPAAETRPLVQLTLQGAGSPYQDAAYVYFQAGATAGLDAQYDASKLVNSTGLNLSTSLPAGPQLSIDGRPDLGTAQLVVPLAVGVPAAGSYSLRATQLLNLRTTPTYLRDLQTGAVVDLAQQPSYQFTVGNAAALLTGRFELVFSPQQALAAAPVALAQQVALYPNPAAGAAYVELPASLGRQPVSASLVDAVGREVRSLTLPAQGAVAHALELRELPTGVYTLHLRTSAGTIVRRLTVE